MMVSNVNRLILLFLWLMTAGVNVAMAYEGVEGFRGATVKGQVVYSGSIPDPENQAVRRDAKFCGKTITLTFIEVNGDSHGVSSVVVSLEGISQGKSLQKTVQVPLQNIGCRFEPQTQVALNGAMVEISSADPVLHNTHLRLNDKTFLNVALPPKGRMIKKMLKRPGRFDVRCDAHTFMRSTIHVFSHPYFTLTSAEGNFELLDVPPGKYELTVWQKATGAVHQAVTVPDSGDVALTIDLNASR